MIVHCFITGVQCQIDEAFVLNRRASHELLEMLKGRVDSLRRVIDQLSPLDEIEPHPGARRLPRTGRADKKHRLVCKTVADAIGPGFPEIKLFFDWPQHKARVREIIQQGKHHKPKEQVVTDLPEHENKP
jgi:hypothetical protein